MAVGPMRCFTWRASHKELKHSSKCDDIATLQTSRVSIWLVIISTSLVDAARLWSSLRGAGKELGSILLPVERQQTVAELTCLSLLEPVVRITGFAQIDLFGYDEGGLCDTSNNQVPQLSVVRLDIGLATAHRQALFKEFAEWEL